MELFPACLSRLRKARGLPLKAVALLAGMDISYVAGLEAGRRSPPRDRQVKRIAAALALSPSELNDLLSARTLSRLRSVTSKACVGDRVAVERLVLTLVGLPDAELSFIQQVILALECLRAHNHEECTMGP
jgi:transcriptional regulator with XRE-family HTH domain